MTHGDDKGLRIPPLLAPTEIVIVPIYRSDEERGRVLEATTRLLSMLTDWERRDPGRLRVHLDARQGVKPGAKYYEWELRGIPLRIEVGPKDLDKNQAMLVRRDTGEKRPTSLDTIGEDASDLLARIQIDMLATARDRLDGNSIRERVDYDRFREIMNGDGAFVFAGWCGSAECEAKIKEETKATIRVLPDEEFRSAEAPTHCLRCGGQVVSEAVWAKAY
jgi:prolyl-tRNA synthetase